MEVDAVLRFFVNAGYGAGKVFTSNVINIFFAENFRNLFISDDAGASDRAAKFSFSSFRNRNPHTNFFISGIIVVIDSRLDSDDLILGFARHFDKRALFRIRIASVGKNAEFQRTRTRNDSLQSSDFFRIGFWNDDFNRIGASLTNGDFFDAAGVETFFQRG